MTPAIALAMRDLLTVPEMHDRLIVGETQRHGAQLITRDAAIHAAKIVPIIW